MDYHQESKAPQNQSDSREAGVADNHYNHMATTKKSVASGEKVKGYQDETDLIKDCQNLQEEVVTKEIFEDSTALVSERQGLPQSGTSDSNEETQLELKSIVEQFGDSGLGLERIGGPESNLVAHQPSAIKFDCPLQKPSLEAPKAFGTEEESTTSGSGNLEGLTAVDTPIRGDITALKGLTPQNNKTDGQGVSISGIRETPSSLASSTLNKSLPPAPDPEPDLPFDFHRFLEQLRHRTADPVAKFLRSFLMEFAKKQWMAHEQVKIISDFLTFIDGKMQQCEIWRGVSDAEFDNAKEGMEKLVMNRLYAQTFSPAIPLPRPYSPVKGKRKAVERGAMPGRRGQHQEDVERDEILAQKVKIYSWVKEEHLDIKSVGVSGKRFLDLAQQELLKIKAYRAPRDKVICVLNCCKVIFGLLRSSKSSDTSADSFIPLLIYVVLHAGPDSLVSNVQYILRFRNQEKLGGEAGYYLSSLMGAIQFIENLDRTSLTITDAEFEKNVEASVSAITEREQPQAMLATVFDKEYAAEVPHNALSPQTRHRDKVPNAKDSKSEASEDSSTDENVMVGGLLETIRKPLSSIGRIFTEDPQITRSSDVRPPELHRIEDTNTQIPHRQDSDTRAVAAAHVSATDTTAPIMNINSRSQRLQHDDVIETLVGMFPGLDRDVIVDVVRMKDGRVGSAVDACLALNA